MSWPSLCLQLDDNVWKMCSYYVFFFSYVQVEPKEGQGLWSNAQEMCDTNRLLSDTIVSRVKETDIE